MAVIQLALNRLSCEQELGEQYRAKLLEPRAGEGIVAPLVTVSRSAFLSMISST